MTFTPEKLKTARDYGYTDDEIWDFLGKDDQRFNLAKENGYSLDETISVFSSDTAQPEPEQPFFALEDAVSAIGTIPEALAVGVPAAFKRLVTGTAMPEESETIERDLEFQERMQREQEDRQAAGKSSVVGEAIRGATPSLGFTVGSGGAAVAGGFAGLLGGPAAKVTVPAGIATASGIASYRMAASDLLYRSFRELEKSKGSPLTDEEKAQAYEVFLPLAQESGLWEAGPEAVSNVLLAGAGKFIFGFGKPVADKIVKESLGRVTTELGKKVAAGTGALAGELAGETTTAVGQFPAQAKAEQFIRTGTTEGAPTEYPGGVKQAFKDVAPSTIALTAGLGLVGGGVKLTTMPFQRRKKPEQIEEDNINLDAEREADNLLIPDTDEESKSIKAQIDSERADLVVKKELYNSLPDGDKAKAVLATEIKEYEGRITALDNTLRQRLGLSVTIKPPEKKQTIEITQEQIDKAAQDYIATPEGARAILENKPFDASQSKRLPDGWFTEAYEGKFFAIPPAIVKIRMPAQAELRKLSILERAALAGQLSDEKIVNNTDAKTYILEAKKQGFTTEEINAATPEARAKWDQRFGVAGNARTVAGEVSPPSVDFAAEEAARARKPKVTGGNALPANKIFGKTAREALQYLADQNLGASELEREGRPLNISQIMQRAASVIAKLPLRILDADFIKSAAGGNRAYRSSEGFIRIPATSRGRTYFERPETLVHEVGHTLTADAIRKYVFAGTKAGQSGDRYLRLMNAALDDANTPEQIKKLISLYKKAIDELGLTNDYFGANGLASTDATSSQKKAFSRKKPLINKFTGKKIGWSELYALANLDEFVAQAWSSPAFQDLLKSIKVKNEPSIFEQFVRIIRDLFGFESDTMAAAVIDASFALAELEAPATRGTVEERIAANIAREKGKKAPKAPTPEEPTQTVKEELTVSPTPKEKITDPATPDEQTQQLVQQAQEQESIVDAAVKEAAVAETVTPTEAQVTEAPAVTPAPAVEGGRIKRMAATSEKEYIPATQRLIKSATEAGLKPIKPREEGALRGFYTFKAKDSGSKIAFSSGVTIAEDNPNELTIEAIYTPPQEREKGSASRLLNEILSIADKNNITLKLEPKGISKLAEEGDRFLTKRQLASWYKRYGFKQEVEGSDDILVRTPELVAALAPEAEAAPTIKRMAAPVRVEDKRYNPLGYDITDVVEDVKAGKTDTPLRAINQVVDQATKLRNRVKAESERRKQPRKRGRAAILERISRERGSGRLSENTAQALTDFVNRIREDAIGDTAISIREKGVSNYDFADNLVTFFLSQDKGDLGTAVSVHEFWHGLSRFLPDAEVNQINQDYVRELEAYIKKNPWFLAFVGRYSLTPEQFEAYKKFNPTEAETKLEPQYDDQGNIIKYKIKFDKENYRYIMLDEFIAEKMTDLVVGKQAIPNTFLGKLAKAIREFLALIKARFGRNPYERFYQLITDSNQRMRLQRESGVAPPIQIYEPQEYDYSTRRMMAAEPTKKITDPATPEEQTQQQVQAAQEQESIVDAAVKEAGATVFDVFNRLVNEGKTEEQVSQELGISKFEVRKLKLRADTAILNKMKQKKVQPLAFQPKNPVVDFAEKNSKKYFTKEGWLPKMVYQSWVKRNAALSREQKEAEYAIKDLYDGIRKVFGISKMEMITKGLVSVPPDFVQQLNDALAGQIDINTMPEPVREPLTRMRQHVDTMSRQLVDLNVLPDDLAAKISDNLGVYLTRSYKIFTDKNWINKIPQEKLNNARNFLYKQQLKSDPTATIEMADRELRNMLNDWASEAEGLRKRGGKLGAKDLSVMMKRAEVPKVLREVMGENMNVVFNYANTIGKISRFLADQRFLNEVKAKGTGQFLFTAADAPQGYNTQIAAEESRTMSPLNGLRTTPEIAKAFEEFGKGYDARENPALYALGWLNAVGKLNLTVGSILTQMRNLLGQPAFFVFNGHYNWAVIRQEVDAIAKDKGISKEDAKRELIKQAAAQGLVNENAYAGELRTAFQEVGLETFDDAGPDEFVKEFVLTRMFKQGVRSAQDLYQKTDEFGKLVGWLNETKRIQRMNKGMDKATAQSIAAERTRDTYPTYSQSSEALRLFRRQPFIGPFATFFYETFRTSFHNLRYAFEDMKGPTPEHRAEGRKRLAGAMAQLSAGAFAINLISQALSNIGDDEEEDVRRMLPPWSKDASLLWLPKSKDGTYNFINLSYINPYNALTDPFIAMMSGFAKGEKPEEIATQAFGSFLSPFVDEQPVSAAIVDAMRNRTETGKQVYNPQDDIATKTSKIMLHIFGKTFTPGTLARLNQRIIPAIEGETVGTRAPAPVREVTAELTGIRFETLDMKAAFSNKAWEFSKAANESERIFRDVATRRRRVNEQEQIDAYRRSEQTRYEIWNEMYRDYMAVRRAGASQSEAIRLMTDIGISKKEAQAIARGRYTPYEVSDEVKRRSKLNGNTVPLTQIKAIGREMPKVLTDIEAE